LFGKGSKEGLMAAETGDNAASAAPSSRALGAVPGSAPAAVSARGECGCTHRLDRAHVEFPNYIWEITAM